MKVYYNNRFTEVVDTSLAEADFIERIILSYHQNGGNKEHHFFVINGYETEEVDIGLINKNFILLIFDENRKSYKALVEKALAAFQAYIGDSECYANHRHYAIPLGHNQTFQRKDYKHINNRSINVFFSGNLHLGRKKFHYWLSGIRLPFFLQHRLQKRLKISFDNKFPNSYLRFTSQFNSGLSGFKYSEMIANSKIVLCPRGIYSVESFRLYEAMMQGCIVITEPMPYRKLFENFPAIVISDWRDATGIIKDLLANHKRMELISHQTLEWYNNTVSPEALGQYMYRMLLSNGGTALFI